MAPVEATIGQTPYAVTITAGGHDLISDEGPALGGQGAGLAPFDLVLAGLGACTAMTLKMYAERKAWPLTSARVALTIAMVRDGDGDALKINRVLTLDGDLSPEQRLRMADIAERTPVTLLIKSGARVHTALA